MKFFKNARKYGVGVALGVVASTSANAAAPDLSTAITDLVGVDLSSLGTGIAALAGVSIIIAVTQAARNNGKNFIKGL